MKSRSAKNKGNRLQNRTVCKILSAFPELKDMDVISVPNSVTGRDIWLSEKAEELFGFTVECKNTEKLNVWAAIKQAEINNDGLIPLVVFSRNHSEDYTCLKFDDLLNMLKLLADLKKAFEHKHDEI